MYKHDCYFKCYISNELKKLKLLLWILKDLKMYGLGYNIIFNILNKMKDCTKYL